MDFVLSLCGCQMHLQFQSLLRLHVELGRPTAVMVSHSEDTRTRKSTVCKTSYGCLILHPSFISILHFVDILDSESRSPVHFDR
jgi:hypothetical protein